MKQYLDLVKHVLENGDFKQERTGTGTKSVFGYQMRFDLSKGFPMLTTKKLHLKSIIYELLWFLKGDTNIQYLINKRISRESKEKSKQQKNACLCMESVCFARYINFI